MDAQENYLLAITVCRGGEIEKDLLTNIVLFRPGPLQGYDKKYLRYKKINKILEKLENKKLITLEDNSVHASFETRRNFVKENPDAITEALDVLKRFRNEKQLVFNLANNILLESPWIWQVFPHDSLKEINDALDLWRKTKQYDAIITKCGRCIESLAVKINKVNELCNKSLSVSQLTSEFRNQKAFEKIPTEKREKFKVLANSMYLIYRLRSKMGAHIDPDFWVSGEVAFAALFLTLFVLDLSLDFVQHKITIVREHQRSKPKS